MQNNKLVSIVLPTYEMCGDGLFFLELNLSRLTKQTYSNFEIVVTDHSVDSGIKDLCLKFSNTLNIHYIKNEEKRGSSSANMNNGILNCSGEIIKLIMQDDYFYDDRALENIVKVFDEDENLNWLVSGCVYGDKSGRVYGSLYPQYTDNIIFGENKIGAPCVLTIRNSEPLLFNENLIWMMDCDYYKRLNDKYGPPFILNETHIFVTQHRNQVTNLISDLRKKEEVLLMKKLYTYDSNRNI
jgi:glycosyltransferase involved in cell wall biosynthesis